MTDRARLLLHKAGCLLPYSGRGGLQEEAIHAGDNSLKGDLGNQVPVPPAVAKFDALLAGTVEQYLLDLDGQFFKRESRIKIIMGCQGLDPLGIMSGQLAPRPRSNGPILQRETRIGHDELFRKDLFNPQAAAFRAGSLGIIKGE
ncbi:hypothetical protein H206_05484 [Candidatus Electrothrix aarhusensis]|uniref:Uncharacterized protein n=1 Tax=Candidatus Electrothrix aarhusensis TaxID=1859131 RepID=A0A3S3RAA8_9BACT|nr:hypothetical protein H206_05484 [Candidatus Electrothrix aarhusensis]